MASRSKSEGGTPPEAVISVIGSGMKVTGNIQTDGSVRIDGSIEGDVRAGKSVVSGKGGLVEGNIFTQDSVLSGRVTGSVVAESRLEVQTTAIIMGDVQARRMQLEEGASLQGQVRVGENATRKARDGGPGSSGAAPAGGSGSSGGGLSSSAPDRGSVTEPR